MMVPTARNFRMPVDPVSPETGECNQMVPTHVKAVMAEKVRAPTEAQMAFITLCTRSSGAISHDLLAVARRVEARAGGFRRSPPDASQSKSVSEAARREIALCL
jgi:hypothetical protein